MTEATWAAWQSLDDLERGQGAWEPQRCEAYDLLLLCRREPMRARRVELHGTCESWKGFDEDGEQDDGE